MIRVEPGTIEDYRALAHLHYLAGEPATCVGVLRAVVGGRCAGALVVSMPTLNGSWRRLGWPGRFDAGDKRASTRRLNAQLRCISRVVVDPRHRALGVATALVRAYLARPMTRSTEAVARMGRACPFFERAGMRPLRPPPTRRDQRLIDALAHLRLDPADLVLAERARALGARLPMLERELRAWAGHGRAGRALRGAPLERIAALAAGAALHGTIAYAHDLNDATEDDHGR